MRRLVGLALVLLLLAAEGAAARTTPLGDGSIGQGDGTASIGVWVAVADGGETAIAPSDSPSLPRAFVTEVTPWLDWNDPFANLCDADGAMGWRYIVTRHTPAGELIGEPETICVPLPDPTDITPPPPPALAEPPTIGQIWNAAGIPPPAIGVSPAIDGVTGLETWLWATSPDEITVDATIDGYTVTGTARRVGFTFDFDDGPPTATGTGGSEAEPAARHTYETKGTYALRVTTRWTAEFTMTGPGLTAPLPVDTATAHVRTDRAYRVVEIRSTLVR